MDDAMMWTVLAGLLGSGVLAGVFYAFSAFVMRSLGDAEPGEGMRVMQAINVRAIGPGLMIPFMGTTLLSIATVVLGIGRWGEAGTLPALVGAVVYLVGCFGVTAGGNVPLNDRLAAADSNAAEGRAEWARYLVVWTRWNHVRTLACLASMALFLLALRGS